MAAASCSPTSSRIGQAADESGQWRHSPRRVRGPDELANRASIRGTRKARVRRRLARNTARHARSVVQTAVQHVSATARMTTFAQNSDIVSRRAVAGHPRQSHVHDVAPRSTSRNSRSTRDRVRRCTSTAAARRSPRLRRIRGAQPAHRQAFVGPRRRRAGERRHFLLRLAETAAGRFPGRRHRAAPRATAARRRLERRPIRAAATRQELRADDARRNEAARTARVQGSRPMTARSCISTRSAAALTLS
jgi:hypothetical protein